MTNHAKISYVKSAVRILGFILLLKYFSVAVLVLIIAEIIGVIEELYE